MDKLIDVQELSEVEITAVAGSWAIGLLIAAIILDDPIRGFVDGMVAGFSK